MAGRERGVMRIIWKSFVASLRPAPKPKIMGEDYNGTQYYEQEPRQDGSHKRSHRYFKPPTKENFEQKIPAEWEAWLRHRRKDAPTAEEVNKNYEHMLKTQENAVKLQQEHEEAKYGKRVAEASKQHAESLKFPSYEEYKNEGQNYELKLKK